MYIDKDAFLTAEKVKYHPTNEACSILENVDLSASQYEIHKQLCRQGRDIRDEYFLSLWRTVITSIKRLFQR